MVRPFNMSQLIPRLSSGQMPPELAEFLRPRVERLGYLGEFFQCAAHQPKALHSFMVFTEELREALGENLTELVALTVSCLMENAYERVQHERRCLKVGLGKPWVRAVESLGRSSEPLGDEERVVQRLVLAVVARRGHDTKDELEAVIRSVGHAKAVAVLMTVGRYVTHAFMVNSLSLEPPVTSPMEEQ
jgi:alkylhydroperoxidase family enzyme